MSSELKNQFDSLFYEYKKEKIMIYGLGRNAEVIVSENSDYNIAGLIANEHIGETKYGKTIYSIEEAVSLSRVIIIAAVASSTGIIFQRIKDVIPENVKVFDMRGMLLNGKEYYRQNEYWNNTKAELYKLIDSHDVISFDIFDTLITRAVLQPKDIFTLLENHAKELYGKQFEGFSEDRINEEFFLYKGDKNPTIEEIYGRLFQKYNNTERLHELLEYERTLELTYIRPRQYMIDILHYVQEQGKEVVFTSDMYLTMKDIQELLHKCNIETNIPIYLSCDRKASKISGDLYRLIHEDYPGKTILHIGNDTLADIYKAKENNIDAFQVLSGYELLALSSASHVLDNVQTMGDRLLLGNIVWQFFDNPFVLTKTRGKIKFENVKQMTDITLVPIFVAYFSFIIKCFINKTPRTIIFFSSRDCYYIHKKYEEIRKKHIIELPESRYFLTSRTAIRSAAILSENDIRVMCRKLKEVDGINLKNFLENQFKIQFPNKFNKCINGPIDEVMFDEIIESVLAFKSQIEKKSAELRNNYLKYIDDLNWANDLEIYMTDIVTQGTFIYSLSNLLDKKVNLIALGTSCIPNDYINDQTLVNSLYGNVFLKEGNNVISFSEMSTFFKILEMVFASSDGQLDRFDENGKPIFCCGTEYSLKLISEIQQEIDRMVDVILPDDWYLLDYSKEFALAMLKILRKEYSDITENLIKLFDFSDPYENDGMAYNLLKTIRG